MTAQKLMDPAQTDRGIGVDVLSKNPCSKSELLLATVVLTGTELGDETVAINELRQCALAYLRVHAQGRPVVNVSVGWTITISRRGINKTLNHAARREHVQSVSALIALLERAVLVFTEANRDLEKARSVPFVHTFAAMLVVAAVTYRVRLVVKQTANGYYYFYDHDLSADTENKRRKQ